MSCLGILEKLADGDRHRIDFLRGNHEDALLEFLEDPIRGKEWLEFGGEQTMASFGIACRGLRLGTDTLFSLQAQLKRALGSKINFLNQLVPYSQSGNTLFTHAGVNPHAKDVLRDRFAMNLGAIPTLWSTNRYLADASYTATMMRQMSSRVRDEFASIQVRTIREELSAVRLDGDVTVLEVRCDIP